MRFDGRRKAPRVFYSDQCRESSSPLCSLQVFPELPVFLGLLSLPAHGLTAPQQELRLTLRRQTGLRRLTLTGAQRLQTHTIPPVSLVHGGSEARGPVGLWNQDQEGGVLDPTVPALPPGLHSQDVLLESLNA